MEELQEKSLKHEPTRIEIGSAVTPFEELDNEVKLAIRCAADKKATDIRVLDLREIASFAEFFIISTGNNQRQVQAVSDEISERLKKDLNSKPVRIEGYNSAEWVLMDYGDFIVHIFNKDARDF